MSAATTTTELALLLDIGTAWVKGSVIGRSRGRWRFVTGAAQPVTWGPDELRRTLVDRLEVAGDARLTGMYDRLLSDATRIECRSPRRQARLAVVAVSRELSGSAARRAAEAAGWQVSPVVSLDDGRSLAERLWVLQSAEVDAWLAVGGFDDAASPRALEAAALVAAARRPDSAPVVWAGSRQVADEVITFFEPGAATVVGNPRPDERTEDTSELRAHLEATARSLVAGEDAQHLSTAALPRAIGTLAAGSGLRILAIDVGARSAMRVLANAGGETSVRVSANGGLAGVTALPGAASRVARLAPDAGDEATVADMLQTLRAFPATVPQLPEELAAMHGAVRLAMGALLEDAPADPIDLLVGCGLALAAAPRPAEAARMLLDGARPVGVTQLAMDVASLLGPLGSLGDGEVREGLELLSGDLLAPLGTAVVTRGGEPGQVAMRVRVHRPGWPDAAPVAVRAGGVTVVPLARGTSAELNIELGQGVSLGGGRRASRVQAMATGGAVGLILDARGVPISLPRRGDDRRALLAAWGEALAREPERVA